MADSDDVFRPMEVFWTKYDTLDDDNTTYIPAVMNPGNRRPQRSRPRVTCKKTKEVKPKAPGTELAMQKPSSKCSQKSNIKHAEVKVSGDSTKTEKATLKDLCSDDKKRVANLIKELARLGEAKETMSGQLESERQIFERRIQDLIDQQDRICKERENVKKQLAECQKLLARYQEYLEQCTDTTLQSRVPLSTTKVSPDICHLSHDDMISMHSQHQPSHRANKHEIPDKHLFPVYFEPKMDTHHKPEQFITLQSQVTKHTPSVRATSLDDRLYSLKLDEDASFIDRPFTKKIDKIIAEEKRSDEVCDGRALYPLPSEVETSRFAMIDGLDFQPLIQDDNHQLVSETTNWDMSNHKKRIQSPIAMVRYSPLENGNRFVNYYKNHLSAEERRHQLLAQKMALLEEQKRLKAILVEQEQMLQLKQDHLHRQQEIQQKRLKHFENTGTFPPHHQSKQPTEVNKHGKQPSSLKKPHPGFDYELLPGKGNTNYNDHMAVGPEYHSTSLHEQQSAHKPIIREQSESSEENEHLIESQIADIHAVIEGQQIEVTKKMMSRATSPIYLTYSDEAVSTEPATEKMHAVENPLSIQTSDLVDLVNEVDEDNILPADGNTHVYSSALRQPQSNSDRAYCDSDNCSYIDDEDPDKEESRVLEDVFFIK